MLVKSNMDFGNGPQKPVNLPSPSAATDAATKGYVDTALNAAIEGLKHKDTVRVRTTSNINLSSPGASLDGVAMAAGDRFLASAQTTGAQNGIYVWNGAAVAATRAADASTFTELVNAIVPIGEGTDAGKLFRQTVATGTIDVTTPVFSAFGTTAGAATETAAGIAEIATQAEADTGTDDARFITPLKMANWSGRKRKHTATFGDGVATQYDFTHNFGSRDVVVSVRQASDDAHVFADIRSTDDNTVRLNFAAAVASNSLKITIIA
jgi:hypothetical protein